MSRSAPAFPVDYSTECATLLVLGSAPCLKTDFDVAKGLRPSHLVMAVNDAADFGPADFIYSGHPEKIAHFRAMQQRHGADFTTHTRRRGRHAYGHEINYIWEGVFSGASSGIGGAHVGTMMGFREIILCGIPLNGGDGYYKRTHPGTATDPRLGFVDPNTALMRGYHERLNDFVKIGKGLVFSMSGLTQKLLGAPPEVPVYAD